jgi:hypothetical protein
VVDSTRFDRWQTRIFLAFMMRGKVIDRGRPSQDLRRTEYLRVIYPGGYISSAHGFSTITNANRRLQVVTGASQKSSRQMRETRVETSQSLRMDCGVKVRNTTRLT